MSPVQAEQIPVLHTSATEHRWTDYAASQVTLDCLVWTFAGGVGALHLLISLPELSDVTFYILVIEQTLLSKATYNERHDQVTMQWKAASH